MIQQNLGSFQLPANLTETIMREVSRIVPTAPTASKPVLPWALSAASAVLIFLLMGVGTQYLSRFQKPYNLNATSEPTVELIEARFVYESPAKPAVRNQAGSTIIPGKSPGSGQQPDARFFAAAAVDEAEELTPTPQWTRTKGPEGGVINNLFTTLSGDIYAGTPSSLYRLTANSDAWQHVNTWSASSLSFQDWLAGGIQMTEHGDVLYLATDTQVLASENKGETWNALGGHPKGAPRGFAVTDAGFYIAFMEDIFFSEDGQTSWVSVKNDLDAEKIRALVAVENTVFIGTDTGLYRRTAETWEQLSVGTADKQGQKPTIHALAASEHRLYVAAGREFTNGTGTQVKTIFTRDNWWSLYRSTDLGDTWYAIDPKEKVENERKSKGQVSFQFPLPNASSAPVDFAYSNIKIITHKAKVMVADPKELFYSLNAGETWIALDLKHWDSSNNIAPPIVMLDANTFYSGGASGIYRTTNAGKSWDQFNAGLAGSPVVNLIAVNKRLYANAVDGFMTSADGGDTWRPIALDTNGATIMAASAGTLYAKSAKDMAPKIYRLSMEGDKISTIPEMPMLVDKSDPEKADTFADKLAAQIEQTTNKAVFDALEDAPKQDLENGEPPNLDGIDFEALSEEMSTVFQEAAAAAMPSIFGNFAVSGETYYIEYQQKLFRWKPGTDAWYDTGLIDTAGNGNALSTMLATSFNSSAVISELADIMKSMGFKIAVSGSNVYVGKRDGHLVQSFDEGETWNDITQDLPFSLTAFNALTFAGTTVYVATDKGVAYSSDGTRWHAVTDAEGKSLVMEELAVEGATVYGIAGQHVYQLKEGSDTWKQVTPEIPDSVIAFAVDANVLYVGTASSGVLRFTLEE